MISINKENNPIYEIVVRVESSHWENHLESNTFDFETETTKIIILILQKLCVEFSYIEISVALADDILLQKLNKQYRNQNKPTNVLSFSYGEQAYNKGILGDLYISYERIHQESLEQKKKFTHHYIHMIIHGILHLLGYDHEIFIDAERMEALEINFLKTFEISNPYILV